MRSFVAACMLLLLITAASAQTTIPPTGGHLVFAVGYGTSGDTPNNYLLLGDYRIDANGRVTAIYDVYDANANRTPRRSRVRHDMQAPYGGTSCQDKLIEIPARRARRDDKGSWVFDGTKLTITLERNTHEWVVDEGTAGGFRLSRVAQAGGQPDLPLAVGFAYASRDPDDPATLAKANFLPYYDGNIYQKDNTAVVTTNWSYANSGLKISAFTERVGGNVLSYTYPSNVRDDMWVQNSILLNYDNDSDYLLYQDQGHDFNRNGCYDEYGHTKKLLAAHDADDGLIQRIVYVEYSYAFDGFPQLSVGRYYPRP